MAIDYITIHYSFICKRYLWVLNLVIQLKNVKKLFYQIEIKFFMFLIIIKKSYVNLIFRFVKTSS